MEKKRKRPFQILTLAILALLCVGALALFLTSREPQLLQRATKVADTTDWELNGPTYRWISNREVLFYRRGSSQYPNKEGWNFFKRDIITDKETYLSGLTRLANDSFNFNSDISISSDGQRIVWTQARWNNNDNDVFCTTLEGKQKIELSQGYNNFAAWMGDSQHLVIYVMDSPGPILYGLIYDLNTQEKPQKIAPPISNPQAWSVGFVTTTNHLLTATWKAKNLYGYVDTDNADIYESVVGDETKPCRHYHVHLPVKAIIWDEQFSPQGDRIPWSIIQQSGSLLPFQVFLHRYIPGFNPQPKPKMSLWVSNIDGGQMHEIGFVPLKPDNNPDRNFTLPVDSDDVPEGVYWLPDGKHISFWLKHTLYTVSAD